MGLYTSADILDWAASGTNESGFFLVGRVKLISPNEGVYGGGLHLNDDGILGNVRLFIRARYDFIAGPTFDIQQNPLPYRVQFSVVGNTISFRVLNLTTGQLIREMSATSSAIPSGLPALWIERISSRITLDNYFVTGTKP